MNKKYIIIILVCIVISLISGIITKDLLIGGTILATGLLCAYFASEGKRVNYILGLINYILIGYVSFKNNLFGIFFFYMFIFAPLQIHGYISWKKNLDNNKNVKVREFNLKNSIIITLSCIICSFILGYLLSLIPGQRLAIMDASSNCINLCGVILMILRFKESWWLWLVNNVVDLTIWIITVINKGNNAVMMLLVSIGYLLINIYGIIKWSIDAKNNKIELSGMVPKSS
ncbi:MAG: nicotinamide mononucleotide transporter [Clostridia bacterium]|nr:nicotinamide mononucleotide transporter [Clostridia bacterium]